MKRPPLETKYTLPDDSDCIVEFRVSPGRPAVMYLPNGDPGYPEDPAELEVIRVTRNGADVTDEYAEFLSESDNFNEVAWAEYEAKTAPWEA